MQSTAIVALLALLMAAPGTTRNTSVFAWTHVRPLSAAAKKLVMGAAEESATVRQLMDALETTDVVAYVTLPPDMWNDKPIASLKFVGASARQRFVLIRIDPWAANTTARAPALAHELQHAVEIGRDPAVRDAASLARLYSRIGWQSGTGEFETLAAQDAERRARHDGTTSVVAGSKEP